MKRVFAVLILTLLIAGGAFAQSGGAKNWISGQLSFLGGGVQYERVLTPKFSVGGGAYFNTFFFLWNNVGVEAMGRFYPLSFAPEGTAWRGLYVQLGLGFGIKTGDDDNYDHEYTDESGHSLSLYGDQLYSAMGFLLNPTVGWKVDPGAPGGFFIEPLISVPIVLGKKEYDFWWFDKNNSKFGAGVGFRVAFGMGYAF